MLQTQSFKLTDLRSMPKIKKAAYKSPVVLTDNGTPEFVFMTVEQFHDLEKKANGK